MASKKRIWVPDLFAGERLRVRTWEDMAGEFGVARSMAGKEYINLPDDPVFVPEMRQYCGMECTVIEVLRDPTCKRAPVIALADDQGEPFGGGWQFSVDMLETVEPDVQLSEFDMAELLDMLSYT